MRERIRQALGLLVAAGQTKGLGKRYAYSLFAVSAILLLALQPLMLGFASAQAVNVNLEQSDASQIATTQTPDTALDEMIGNWQQLDWINSVATPQPTSTTSTVQVPATPSSPAHTQTVTTPTYSASDASNGDLVLDPTDLNALMACADPNQNCQVDVRVINYLLNLVMPTYMGGGGQSYIQASILNGYDTSGIGQYDRTTLAASTTNPTTEAAETTGQAVDISEVGQVTCKETEHRRIGGDTTIWQPALPVKVAWQSTAGIANSPTPTGSSLIGVSGSLGAQGITAYLNGTGDLDQYIDYAKGLNLSTIAQYVGANVLMKDLGTGQITSDPLASNIIQSVGDGILTQQLLSLPPGLNAQNGSTNVQEAAGIAQFENALGLPSGSLNNGFGWVNILTGIGKRAVEQDFGLPTNYLNTNSLTTLNSSATVQGAYGYSARSDAALNFPTGTVALLQKNNTKGLELAGVNILGSAFKLTSTQQQAIVSAINAGQTPTVDPTGMNNGSLLSVNGSVSLFSSGTNAQQAAASEFAQIGTAVFQKALSGAAPSQFTGLTQTTISSLLNPKSNLSLGSLATSLGVTSLLSSSSINLSQVNGFISNPNSGNTASLIATSLNSLFSLSGNASLSSQDVTGMMNNNNSALLKIGGAEIGKAFNWNSGTGVGVVTGSTNLSQAMQQSLINGIGNILGLNQNQSSSDNASNPIVYLPSGGYGPAIINNSLGISVADIESADNAQDLANQQQDTFYNAFGVTNLQDVDWDDSNLNDQWNQDDLAIGAPAGTTKGYLQGQISSADYAEAANQGSINQMNVDEINAGFGLIDSTYQLPATDPNSKQSPIQQVLNYVKTDGAGLSQTVKDQALGWIDKLVGNGVDNAAGFSPNSFASFFSASTTQTQTTNFIDMGLKSFIGLLGANNSDTTYSTNDLNNIFTNIKGIFNDLKFGTSGDTEYTNNPSQPNSNQIKGIPTAGLLSVVEGFLLKTTGIPSQYQSDASTFLAGDWQTGMASMGFVTFAGQINQNLPANDQLTYAELRQTIGDVDPSAVDAQVQALNPGQANPSTDETVFNQVRQQMISQASQNVQYQVSDSFLRKADPTIPAGFSQAMMAGNPAQRGQVLENFTFSNIDTAIQKADPSYIPGTLEALFTGKNSTGQPLSALQKQAISLPGLISQLPISLGPLSAKDISNLVTYFTNSASNQAGDLTNGQFSGTFTDLDHWLSTATGISALPVGLSKSLFLAGQNGWNFNKSLTDSNGNVVVPSLNTLSTTFMTQQVSVWADQALHLPLGSVYKVYTAINSVVQASQALQLAELSSFPVNGLVNLSVTNARNSLTTAQAGLALVVITTALAACTTCQQFFSTIDNAIGAPPGFTNQVATAAIAFALHLPAAGWAALGIAVAMYFLGVNSVSYDCPLPPVDQYAITSYDPANDQVGIGYTPGQPNTPTAISSAPSPGQSPFQWQDQDQIKYTNGDNKQVWEGWARYYVGSLLQATMNYGATQEQVNQPLQVVTYRQANAEYFLPQLPTAFGPDEVNNPYVGLGYSYGSTNVVNTVHVSFGGLF